MNTEHAPPRHLAPLNTGPWLRDRRIVRIFGLICLAAMGVILGALVLGPWINPNSAMLSVCFWALIYAMIIEVFGLLLLLLVWVENRAIQYCPDCLQYMTRGARVCPYCGFQDKQASTAVPAVQPVHVTSTPLRQGKRP